MAENSNKTHEQAETEPTHKFDKVIFGHPYPALDADQLITYYIAAKAGLIAPIATFDFKDEVNLDNLLPNEIAIEGIRNPNSQLVNQTEGNAFDNGTDGTPAGSMLYQAYNRRFDQQPHAQSVRNLSRWLTATEKPNAKDKSEFSSEAKSLLSQLTTNVIRALKEQNPDNPVTTINQIYGYLDQIITITSPQFDESNRPLPPNREQIITQLQALEDELNPLISLGQSLKDRDRNQQENALTNEPNRLQTYIPLDGPALAYLDLRGIPGNTGAFGIAKELSRQRQIEPQIFFVTTNHETDPSGVKIMIRTSEFEGDQLSPRLQSILSERLNQSEQLFGKGWRIIGFGGHPGISVSPRESGSGLDPTQLWPALKDFFRYPRYSQSEFNAQIQEFASESLALETVSVISLVAENEYTLPEWQARISVPHESGNFIQVSLTEHELPLYLEYAQKSQLSSEELRKLLVQKTIISEPPPIADFRSQKAQQRLEAIAAQGLSAENFLNELNDLNPAQINEFPLALRISILNAVSTDPEAIDMIYNPNNLRYKITHPDIREWLREDIDKYKGARYHYLSVPYKFDSILCNPQTILTLSENDISAIVDSIQRIVTTPEYFHNHPTVGPDRLVYILINLLTRQELSNSSIIANQLIKTLSSPDYWSSFAQVYPNMYQNFLSKFPQYKDQLPPIESKTGSQTKLPLISDNELTQQADEEIFSQAELARANGEDFTINYLVQIGRQINTAIQNEGIINIDGTKSNIENFQFSLSVNGSIDMTDERQEDQLILDTIIEHIFSTWQKSQELQIKPKIRIVTSGLPVRIQREIPLRFMSKLFNDPEQTETIKDLMNNLIFVDFNAQDRQYYERPALRPSQTNRQI